ncbi:hypothetical protein KHQ81_15620 (plasmid) [Mycoplasmatota bacterium]|nr:hypothetical protein KHQ81_15620 [Mycoplasmatota bacterium]
MKHQTKGVVIFNKKKKKFVNITADKKINEVDNFSETIAYFKDDPDLEEVLKNEDLETWDIVTTRETVY